MTWKITRFYWDDQGAAASLSAGGTQLGTATVVIHNRAGPGAPTAMFSFPKILLSGAVAKIEKLVEFLEGEGQ